MNSPVRALIWEIWWRNRWGFVLLLGLWVGGVALRLGVGYFERSDRALRAAFEARTRGTLLVDEVLPRSEAGPVAAEGRIQVGRSGYSGLLSPGDRFAWMGQAGFGGQPQIISARLNDLEFCQPDQLPAQISLTAEGGGRRTIHFGQTVYSLSEQIADATVRVWSCRRIAVLWSILSIAFSYCVLCAAFATAEPHSQRGFTGIPSRRFALPVTTWTLVGWPLGLGAAAVLVMWLAWAQVVLPGVASLEAGFSGPYMALLLMAGLAVFQALVWGLASFPKVRAWLLTAVMLGLVIAAMLAFTGMSEDSGWGAWQSRMSVVWAGAWLAACAAAWLGARYERQGTWTGGAGWRALDQLRRPLQEKAAFASEQHAQFWMEWRRNGRLPIMIWAALVVAAVGADWVVRGLLNEPAWMALTFSAVLSIAAGAWIVVTGLNLARDGASSRLLLSAFSASRPVSSGRLLEAKLAVGFAVWAAAAAMAGLGIASSVLTGGGRGEGFELLILGVTIGVISLHVFVGILPLCLTGRIPGLPWSLLPLLLVYGAAVDLFIWLGTHRQYSWILFPLVMALLLVKLLVAFWGFRRAMVERLTSACFVRQVVGLWLLVSLLLIWAAAELHISAGWNEDAVIYLPVAALLVPLARIGLSPLAVRMNRHR